jgi:hypothetical protein
MRKLLLIVTMLLGALLPTLIAAPAQAGHHHWGRGHWGHGWHHGGGWNRVGWHRGWGWNHGWGWGRHRYWGWGHHRPWGWGGGWGRPVVYRSFYRPVYGVGFGGYFPINNFGVPSTYDYGYPVINSYYYGCDATPTYIEPSVDSAPIYNAQVLPGRTIVQYAGSQPRVSTELTDGMLIARLADALRQRGNATDGRIVASNNRLIGNGRLLGNGRLQGVLQQGVLQSGVVQNVVQNITGSTVRNEAFPGTVRISNLDSRTKARAYMAQGDSLFLEQRYAAAAQQYRAAASMAPDLAEANWRYGHTLVAMGEYDLAAHAIRRALAVNADIARSGFSLDQLYGTVGTAKASHLEGLAQAALDSDSANAYFLLGVTLHYSGEPARAEKFFAQAAELQGPEATHVAAFLTPEQRAPQPSSPPRVSTPRLLAQDT